MALIVNNKDQLTYILTSYGLRRVAEALADPEVDLNIFKMKVGDANGEFYTPYESMTELVNPIPDGEFYILDKELLEDNLTISLHAVFPETLDNCEIREIGIYETVNGIDYLFAISTQQPMVKPSTSLRYFISVDYYAFIKSQNLSNVYDQIILDPDDRTVTKEQLDNLMSTILFTESNLMEQINGNSRVIGLNRAQQLSDKIEDSKREFGYITTYNNYTNLLNYVSSDNIYSYWVFDYPRRIAASASIVDISKFKRNLSTDTSNSGYERSYAGFMSTLDFKEDNYFFLNQGNQEISFNNTAFTILPYEYTSVNVVNGVAYGFVQGWIEAGNLDLSKDFQIKTKYKLSTEDTSNVILSVGTTDNLNLALVVNGKYTLESAYTQEELEEMTENEKKAKQDLLDERSYHLCAIIVDSEGKLEKIETPLKVNFDNWEYVGINYSQGVFSLSTSTAGESWEVIAGSERDVEFTPVSKEVIIGRGLGTIKEEMFRDFPGSVDLKYYSLINNGVQVVAGAVYKTINELVFLDKDRNYDIPFTVAYVVEANSTNKDRTILARSNYATSSHVFEITETKEGELKIVLFTDSNSYLTFTSLTGVITPKIHSVVLSYNPDSKDIRAIVNNKEVVMSREETGEYTHMNGTPSMLYSFVCRDEKIIYTKDQNSFRVLYNSDGTINKDASWGILERQDKNIVVYNGSNCAYTENKNTQTDKLFAWISIDGSLEEVYTKELNVSIDTVLYNEDYSINDTFEIKDLGSGPKIIHRASNTEAKRKEGSDINSVPLFAFVFTGGIQTIWANDKDNPSVLYMYNGDLYKEVEWVITEGSVYWKGIKAIYSPQGDHAIPSTPVTSYVTGHDGNPKNMINSKVGVIAVMKTLLSIDEMRVVSLNLEATSGKNPCIYDY